MNISDFDLSAILEAILFSSAQPVEVERLSTFLDLPEIEIENCLAVLSETLLENNRGICLINRENRWQMTTKLELGVIVSSFLDNRRNALLSNAALEVLAITAYNQPVTKTYISQIRGISSSEIVENLVEKGILEQNGKLDLPGRPMSYITTDKFLTIFGLSSLDDLPAQENLKPVSEPEEENA